MDKSFTNGLQMCDRRRDFAWGVVRLQRSVCK